MLKKITFIGNPSGEDGRPWVEVAGKTLHVGRPEVVDLQPGLLRKLEGNNHFRLEEPELSGTGSTPAPRRVAEPVDPPVDPQDDGDPQDTGALPPVVAPVVPVLAPVAPPVPSTPATSTAADDAPITVKRAKPRTK